MTKCGKYKIYTDGYSKVMAVSTYAGKPVKGTAVCNPDDEFDYDIGAEIAMARCNTKIARKRVNNARAQLKFWQKIMDAVKREVDKNTSYYYDSLDALYAAIKTENDTTNV